MTFNLTYFAAKGGTSSDADNKLKDNHGRTKKAANES
jgi:hypothetical protein